MIICVLTSSRADFGIYLPLLKKLQDDDFFDLKLVVFGTHLSKAHGETVNQILENGFTADYRIETLPEKDSPKGIADGMGKTMTAFSSFWNEYGQNFDLVVSLGDRYEMFAAVMAGVPFQLPIAHLHGGETTLGAIDNVFRHAITLASRYHFVSTEEAAERVRELTQTVDHIYNVGALSLDNINNQHFLTLSEFKDKWNVDLSHKTILTTFHPETISLHENARYADELVEAIEQLKDYQLLITMPNADTNGNVIRKAFIERFTGSKQVFLIENLGSQGYFTAMKHCSFLIGNTSSGIIEAASFGKYVINLGNRQKGRVCGRNVIDVPIETTKIVVAARQIETLPAPGFDNCYYNGGAADKIIEVLKRP